ncbi:hypothetical protein A33M_1249 [Rhodovulum sp. PH10]|uniref:endonuclease domain-containing protein n=1 Tax=Rhodovulum sp. PH10 TaxID=1187851 RepID=UPI00027C20FD|nr:DUF559 domain-containing protein [Rhodovulum sp. PH10]EJW09492.1 hypothetical protein A33M_1249 [Rhodovulum sp. PH10]
MTTEPEREMTEGERLLWRTLRTKRFGSAKFRRGVPVGPWRAAFFCEPARIVVEVDEQGTPAADGAATTPRDPARDQWFFAHGFRVLLFRRDDIAANVDGIMQIIETEIRSAPRGMPRNTPSKMPTTPAGAPPTEA